MHRLSEVTYNPFPLFGAFFESATFNLRGTQKRHSNVIANQMVTGGLHYEVKLLEKLQSHQGVTYNAKWHERQALMASSSHDGTVKTWW
jgi:hypothetical protein